MVQYSRHTLQSDWHQIVFFFINSNIFNVEEEDIVQNNKT